MKRGYAVFRALSPACFCDLIAAKKDSEKMMRLEVRTGYQNPSNGKMCFPKNLHGDTVTHFAVYERNNGKVHYFLKDGVTETRV